MDNFNNLYTGLNEEVIACLPNPNGVLAKIYAQQGYSITENYGICLVTKPYPK